MILNGCSGYTKHSMRSGAKRKLIRNYEVAINPYLKNETIKSLLEISATESDHQYPPIFEGSRGIGACEIVLNDLRAADHALSKSLGPLPVVGGGKDWQSAREKVAIINLSKTGHATTHESIPPLSDQFEPIPLDDTEFRKRLAASHSPGPANIWGKPPNFDGTAARNAVVLAKRISSPGCKLGSTAEYVESMKLAVKRQIGIAKRFVLELPDPASINQIDLEILEKHRQRSTKTTEQNRKRKWEPSKNNLLVALKKSHSKYPRQKTKAIEHAAEKILGKSKETLDARMKKFRYKIRNGVHNDFLQSVLNCNLHTPNSDALDHIHCIGVFYALTTTE